MWLFQPLGEICDLICRDLHVICRWLALGAVKACSYALQGQREIQGSDFNTNSPQLKAITAAFHCQESPTKPLAGWEQVLGPQGSSHWHLYSPSFLLRREAYCSNLERKQKAQPPENPSQPLLLIPLCSFPVNGQQ